MKKILALLSCAAWTCPFYVQCQPPESAVSGWLPDAQQQALSFAHVLFYKAVDSILYNCFSVSFSALALRPNAEKRDRSGVKKLYRSSSQE